MDFKIVLLVLLAIFSKVECKPIYSLSRCIKEIHISRRKLKKIVISLRFDLKQPKESTFESK